MRANTRQVGPAMRDPRIDGRASMGAHRSDDPVRDPSHRLAARLDLTLAPEGETGPTAAAGHVFDRCHFASRSAVTGEGIMGEALCGAQDLGEWALDVFGDAAF
jgi:hypothetical protein